MSGALAFTPIQVPDFGATMARAQGMQANRLSMLAAQRQMQQDDALQAAIEQHAGTMGSADPAARMNALTALAQSGPRGLQVALPLIQQLRQDQDFYGLGGASASPGAPAMTSPAPGGSSAPSGDPALPRGLRNNNPLNLSYVAGQPGVQGSDGRFGVYASPEEGIAASVRQLQLYAQRGVTRLGDIINRWAPPSENNTGGYVASVARAAGIRPDEQVDLSNPGMVTRLVQAMAQVENGRPLDPAVASRGVAMALGGGSQAPVGAIPVADNGQSAPAPAAAGAAPDALPNVPGFNMDMVRRAMTMPNNPTAAAYFQRYMQAAQLMQRDNNLRHIDLGDGAPEGPGRYEIANGRVGRRLGAIPPPATQTVIDQRGQSAYDQRRGETLATEEQAVRSGLSMANQTLARLNSIERNLNQITTGVGSGARLTLGQVANQLGVPPEVMQRVGLDPGSVASGETIRSQASQLLLGMLGPGGFPTQGFSNADREMLERALPSLANSPTGNRAIIGVMRAAAERQREIAVAWNEWRRTNGNGMESFDRFQLERLPQITDRDVMPALLSDYVPATPAQGGSPPAIPIQSEAPRPATPAPPAPGEVRDGYRFRGGNPADRNAWEPVR